MTMPHEGLEACEKRLRVLLPETYQESYETVQPVSMGSAGLRFGADGRVAWDEMWGAFCDLAMAGGPPHKGRLLESGAAKEIVERPDQHREVVAEICRGIHLVTGLHAAESRMAGWVRVDCTSAAMAAWLQRAITMENVAVRSAGLALGVPAGPGYRLEKEIKNVITVVAKSCHYWMDHMSEEQHDAVGEALRRMEADWPAVQAAPDTWTMQQDEQRGVLVDALAAVTGFEVRAPGNSGWVGLEMPDVRSAVWVMRMLAGLNVLARREETTLCLPVAAVEPAGMIGLVGRVQMALAWAVERGVLASGTSEVGRPGPRL